MLYTRLQDITPQAFDRIVSVVPSQTKLLYDLSLENEVLGITKFCIHPAEWKNNKAVIGGTKNLNINKIIQLKPNLIIANKEENVRTQIEILAAETTVFLTDVNNFDDALQMILQLGQLTGRIQLSESIVDNIQKGFMVNEQLTFKPSKAVYLIWNDPMMSVGGDTFINSMMAKAGFENMFAHLQRYPVVSPEMISDSQAEYLLLSSEPYPFNEKHIVAFRSLFPKLKVILVDGESFSWYGSSMIETSGYFRQLRNNMTFC